MSARSDHCEIGFIVVNAFIEERTDVVECGEVNLVTGEMMADQLADFLLFARSRLARVVQLDPIRNLRESTSKDAIVVRNNVLHGV
jgi:hypothetical protein